MASGSQNNTSFQAQKWTNLRAFTIGDTSKNVNGTSDISWTKSEIIGSGTSAQFLRGDHSWTNVLTGDFNVNGIITAGTQVSSSAPTSLASVNRLTITPYFHTGGPWYIKSMDDSSDAFLALYYGNSELLRIKHEGTFQASIKANITGHADEDLALSGGDMTGSIRQKMTGVTRGATPGTNQYRTYEWIDNGDKRVAQVEYGMLTNGESRLNLFVLGNNTTSTGDEYSGIVIYKKVGVSGNTTATYNANNGTFSATTFSGTLSGNAASASVLSINNDINLSSCLQYIQTASQNGNNDLPTSGWWHVIKMNHGNGGTYFKRLLAFNFWGAADIRTATAEGNGVTGAWKHVWVEGNAVTSAVWNDYAEARESFCTEPGRTVQETGSDTLTLITERLTPCAGIVSDTWGFSQGETDNAKTHIAVAGRVLAYPYRDRNEYKPGDVLCAAPGGTVDIMTREEIIQYPDRIVGTVSCVPDYDEWGGGEGADRPPVKVNGRIWVKVK